MLYVPYVPPQPPSPRTRELADLLTRAIEEYQKYHPNVSSAEVNAALQMASVRSSKGVPARVWALGGAVGAALLGGVFVVLAANQGNMPAGGVPMVAVAVAILGALVAVVVAKSRGA